MNDAPPSAADRLRDVLEDAGAPWVFGYGSLMWDPGFQYLERQRGWLRGYHRSLCVLSIRNRGTVERPGLALGLARGGSCWGIAFRLDPNHQAPAIRYLAERELANNAYDIKHLPVHLDDGRQVRSLVFISRRDHPQFAGDLAIEERAQLVAQGVGSYGTALDYLRNVVLHLDECGIVDTPLHDVLTLAEAKAAERD